jgi:hypothetical protein
VEGDPRRAAVVTIVVTAMVDAIATVDAMATVPAMALVDAIATVPAMTLVDAMTTISAMTLLAPPGIGPEGQHGCHRYGQDDGQD